MREQSSRFYPPNPATQFSNARTLGSSLLPSLFTSSPSSLILLIHDSHLSPQFPPFHCRRVCRSSHSASSPNANPSRFLHPQTTRRSRSSNHPRRIPRPPPPRAILDVSIQSRLRRHPRRPRHFPLLLHRHPLVAKRTPARADHSAHRPAHPHLPRVRRSPHARIPPLLRRSPRLAGRREPLTTNRHFASRPRSPHRPCRDRGASPLVLHQSGPSRSADLRFRLRLAHHNRLPRRKI